MWLRTLFPKYLQRQVTLVRPDGGVQYIEKAVGFGEHHKEFWKHVQGVSPGYRPYSFIAIWPRGGAKSTSIELAITYLAARHRKRYALYVCSTQERADDHVSNVASMLESPTFSSYYPTVSQRSVGKYGNVKGWRRNRLWTASGFVLDAIGLDTAARGVKIDEARPDLIIFDDIDEDTDTEDATKKKISILTKRLIPAGSSDLAILGVQNLIHPEGVFARLAGVAEVPADFLHRRIVSGPFPALTGMAWETYEKPDGAIGYKITSGEPMWEGQDVEVCQEMIDDMGLTSFLQECQQEVDIPENGLFAHVVFRHVRRTPDLVRTVVWVDPAITDTDNSDCQAISVAGISESKKVYILYSWQQRASPQTAMRLAIKLGLDFMADHIGVETDQGGDTWISVYNEAVRHMQLNPEKVPPFVSAKAGAGQGSKVHRANQLLTDYEKGMIMHVINQDNTHELLERMLRRFPVKKPFDLVDVTEWSRRKLRGTGANLRMMPFVGNRVRVDIA